MYRNLGPELGGAMSAFIDLCCLEGGMIEDHDRYISGQFGIDIRKWKRFKVGLIRSGDIYECYDTETGKVALSSGVADEIIRDGKKIVANNSRAGKISAAGKKEKRVEMKKVSARTKDDTNYSSAQKLHIKSNTIKEMHVAPVEHSSNHKEEESRKETKRLFNAKSIGEIILDIDEPIINAASRDQVRQKKV